MWSENRPLEPAKPCCSRFEVSFPEVFLPSFVGICIREPKPHRNYVFTYVIAVKASPNLCFYSGFRRDVLTPAAGEMWSENRPLEPARPCCFPVLKPRFLRSSCPVLWVCALGCQNLIETMFLRTL